jgi:hypothetical protein
MTDPNTPEDPSVLAAAGLRELARSLRAPSSAAQIRRLLPDIETAIDRGANHAQVLQTLKDNGIDMPLRTFRNELYQARKKRDKGGRKGGSPTIPGAGATAAPHSVEPVPAALTPPESGVPDKAMTPAQALRNRMAESRKTKDPLAPAPSPRKWDFDPLEQPELTFVDKPTDQVNPQTKDPHGDKR